jgi:homoserine O-succinyltransferase/O-acetyltransferase
VESVDGDFHLGTSPDGIRMVYLQGHPEYDRTSLLKEYKREVIRYLAGELDRIPPYPDHYLPPEAARMARRHLEAALEARESGAEPPPSPKRRSTRFWTTPGPTRAR